MITILILHTEKIRVREGTSSPKIPSKPCCERQNPNSAPNLSPDLSSPERLRCERHGEITQRFNYEHTDIFLSSLIFFFLHNFYIVDIYLFVHEYNFILLFSLKNYNIMNI